MKKILAMLVVTLLLCSMFAFAVGAETERTAEEPLVDFIVDVEGGRQPRILQLADPQIIDPSAQEGKETDVERLKEDMEERCFRYIRQVVHNTQPDLILIAGDLVYGYYDHSGVGFEELVKFMDSFGIPWAPVYGNHDAESNMGVLWQNEQLEKAEHCLFKAGDMTGNGNYTVGIRQNGKLTRVFFMMDTHGCNLPSQASIMHVMPGGTGFMEDQVEWFIQKGAAIKETYPDANVSFVFHIPFAAFNDAMATAGRGDKGLTAKGEENFGYGIGNGADWDRNRGVYNAMKELGTDSVLVGHLHHTSASVVYDGVRFQFGQKSSTYDSINYRLEDGSIVDSYNPETGEPIVGGTLMMMDEQTGDFVDFEIVLYKEEPKEENDFLAWLIPVICAVVPAILAGLIVMRDRRK